MEEKKFFKEGRSARVILYNDWMHSFEYVVHVLTTTLGVDEEMAGKYAIAIHHNQRVVIFKGELEHAEYVHQAIENFEPEERNGKYLLQLATEVI